MACRKNGWALDRSVMYTEVINIIDCDDIEERPPTVNKLLHKSFIQNKRRILLGFPLGMLYSRFIYRRCSLGYGHNGIGTFASKNIGRRFTDFICYTHRGTSG